MVSLLCFVYDDDDDAAPEALGAWKLCPQQLTRDTLEFRAHHGSIPIASTIYSLSARSNYSKSQATKKLWLREPLNQNAPWPPPKEAQSGFLKPQAFQAPAIGGEPTSCPSRESLPRLLVSCNLAISRYSPCGVSSRISAFCFPTFEA